MWQQWEIAVCSKDVAFAIRRKKDKKEIVITEIKHIYNQIFGKIE